MLVLRDYQIKMLNGAINCLNRQSNPFVVSPTGSGKMIVIAALAKHLDMNVLIVEHRIELVKQAVEKLRLIGEIPGVIVSGIKDPNPAGRIKVGMIQTIHRREARLSNWKPGCLMIDEAHLSAANSYLQLIDRYKESPRVLLSATPWRLDGKGFLGICDELVFGPSIKTLVKQGYLVPTEYLSYDCADFSGLKDVAGKEYDEEQVASAMEKITDVIADTWYEYYSNRTTVVFCANTRHSKSLCEEFKKKGIRAEHVDGSTPDEVRAKIIERVRSGETRVLCNCGVVVEGFDAPIISCVILAIATKSLSKYLQCCGRGMRPHPESGKKDLVVMDFGECYKHHGTPEDDRRWSLENRKQKRDTEYIEAITESQGDVVTKQLILNTYQPDLHDYGGAAGRIDNDEWKKRYQSSGKPRNQSSDKPRNSTKQAVNPQRVQLLAAGAKMPPRWLPPTWHDYWFSLEAYRLYWQKPTDYSESAVRAELSKRTRI